MNWRTECRITRDFTGKRSGEDATVTVLHRATGHTATVTKRIDGTKGSGTKANEAADEAIEAVRVLVEG